MEIDKVKKVHIVATDEVSSTINIFKRPSTEDAPVIICFPAMGVKAKYYDHLALVLLENGFNVVTVDLRGVGTSSIRSCRKVNFGYKEMVEYDWPAVIQYVKRLFAQNRIFLLGHSLGGQLSTLYEANTQDNISGLILVAACSVFYKKYPFPYNIKTFLGTNLAYSIAYLFGYFPGGKIGFAGNEAMYVIRDWAYQSRTGRYELKNSEKNYEVLLEKVNKPVLAISIYGDTLAPPDAVKHLCGKLKRSHITYWHYKPDKNLKLSVNHFTWVKQPEAIVMQISDWIKKL